MEIAAAGFGLVLVLIFFGVPVAISMAAVGFLGFGHLVGWQQAESMLGLVTRDSTMVYALAVVPLFILMGNFVAGTGVSRELYHAAQSFLGGRRGGLASATVVASGGFAAICGSSIATVVTMGRVALPSMRHYGYSDSLSTAAIAAGATLGVLIPPSILLVVYGIITDTHIGKLYAAGFVPGLLGILLYVVAVAVAVRLRPTIAPRSAGSGWVERLSSLKGVWAALLLFMAVILGIYSGFVTATEASGIGAFGAFAIGVVRRRLSLKSLYIILIDSARTTAILFALVIGATMFTEFLNYTGAHDTLRDFVVNSGFPPWGVILIICVIYIGLGMLMETMSMVLLTVPLFFPIVTGLGFDPVWFGILVVALCELGMITPPVGLNLFIMRSVAPDVNLVTIVRGILPFVAVDILRIGIIAAFPIVSLFLPHLLFK